MDATDYSVWNQSGFLIHPSTVDAFYSTLKSHKTDGHKQFVDPVAYEIATTIAQPKEKWLKLKIMLSKDLGQTYTIVTLFPYTQIEIHQKALVQNIVITLTAGLLLQYLLLIKVIGRASNTLVHQKDSLNQKNQELQHTYEQLNISFHATVKALADSVDARDAYTAGHVGRVMQYSQSIGEALGLNQKSLTQLILAAQMHDIGKIGIADAILLKPFQLSDSEYEIIKSHPQIGVAILENIPDFKEILPGVLHHHERFDGLGYPQKLSGFDIPLNARIIAVADAYDAMTTNRPYRKSLNHSEALLELIKNRGAQFDPAIIDKFIEILSNISIP